jgi:hypothetical protein
MGDFKISKGQAIYKITVKGCLNSKWTDWFDEMSIVCDADITSIRGPVKDQAALHGILNKIRDLNLTLLSLERIEM